MKRADSAHQTLEPLPKMTSCSSEDNVQNEYCPCRARNVEKEDTACTGSSAAEMDIQRNNNSGSHSGRDFCGCFSNFYFVEHSFCVAD